MLSKEIIIDLVLKLGLDARNPTLNQIAEDHRMIELKETMSTK